MEKKTPEEIKEEAVLASAYYKLWCESFLNFLDYVYVSDPLRGAVKFEKWPHLLQVIDALLKHRLVVILKARQIGISWLLAAYALWMALTKVGASIFLISKGEREAMELLSKCKFIYKHLPESTRLPLFYDSATSLGFDGVDSKIVALPSTETAGRGEAATLVIGDEWDYHQYAEQNYAALKPTIDAGGQFIGATTSKKDEPESLCKKIIRGAIEGVNNFYLLFFNWRVRPGRDDDWYEQQKKEYPDYQLEQEYPNSLEEALAPLVGKSVFDRDALLKLIEISETPKPDNNVYKIHPPVVGVKYVAGVDVGEGVGLDYSVLTVIGRTGLAAEVCAVIWGNEIKTDYFAYQCDQLCREYFKPILAVENNGLGLAVLNKLEELSYPKLYHAKTPKGDKKPKAGWSTNPTSRIAAITDLATAIGDSSLTTRFKPQVLEMMNFYWKEGRPEAAKGAHDDLVMSLVIAYQMLKEAPSYGPAPHIPMVYRK